MLGAAGVDERGLGVTGMIGGSRARANEGRIGLGFLRAVGMSAWLRGSADERDAAS